MPTDRPGECSGSVETTLTPGGGGVVTPPLVEVGDCGGLRKGEAVRSCLIAGGKLDMCRLSLVPRSLTEAVAGAWCSLCTTSAKEMKLNRRTSLGSSWP